MKLLFHFVLLTAICAPAVADTCKPKPLILPLTAVDADFRKRDSRRPSSDADVNHYGCGGMTFEDWVSHAETAGGARVRVTFTYAIVNESGEKRGTGFRITILLGEREYHGTVRTISGAKRLTTTSTFLLPETEVRLGPPPMFRIEMVVYDP